MEVSEKIRSKIRQASFESQALSEKVKRMTLPENVEQWLDDAFCFAQGLVNEQVQKPIILRYVSFAKHAFNNEQLLKTYLYQIQMNIEYTKHDLGLQKQASGSKTGGEKVKRREWADQIADWLIEKYPTLKQNEVWLKIPDSTAAQLLDDEGFHFYRDGDDLVKTENKHENKLKKSTFFKNYFKK